MLKPIYELKKKGTPFIWGDKQQKAFDKIKSRLLNPPVLSMPDKRGRFLPYLDTSKFATGSAFYHIQNGKHKLIAYVSKRMPEAARNYSITELEMCGLAINIASFAHLLKRVDFDALVDHLVITDIMKSKMEPATNRIKRLLEVLSSYSFNLYYIKGKDIMIHSDFLSRQIEHLHEIIPISFNIWEILQDSYHSMVMDTYNVQMRAQVKAQTNAPTAVDTQPITQKVTPNSDKLPSEMKEESNMKRLPSRIIQQSPEGIALPPETIFPPVVAPPNIRLPLKPPNVKETIANPNLGPDSKMDIEENSPHQEGIIMETNVAPDRSYLEQPQALIELVNTSKLVQKHLP